MISIIYAHRNRDVLRIKASLISLDRQQLQNFEVVFVDYGSEASFVSSFKRLCNIYDFVTPYFLPVSQLLWNKSKALNYGIKKATSEYIFIADVDLVFHPETTRFLQQLAVSDKFYLFKLGYLSKSESPKLQTAYDFSKLKPERLGEINGMILTSRESLVKVNGFDEFFHFYGAEDEDLFARLQNAGYEREKREEEYFYHQWHQSFSGSEDRLLTANPRIKNIMRINYRHHQRNQEREIVEPLRQQYMGNLISPEKARVLENPDYQFKIPNIQALVEYFLREELPSRKGEVVQAVFYEDKYYRTFEFKIKKFMGIQAQPYIPLKEVNDIILKEILYNYRDRNYSFKIGKDLKNIIFCLEI